MRLLAAITSCVACLALPSFAHADVTIEIDAGILYNFDGSAKVLAGGLLQLIASPVTIATPDGVFTPPTFASFVTGNDILVSSVAMNYGNGSGRTQSVISFSLGTGVNPIVQGDALLLRWYPTLTTASASPGMGATYGQYRSDTGEKEGGRSWFVPTDGTYSFPNGLNFNTIAAGGLNPETAGRASNVVLVPEPSTYVLTGFASAALAAFALMRRRGSVKG